MLCIAISIRLWVRINRDFGFKVASGDTGDGKGDTRGIT